MKDQYFITQSLFSSFVFKTVGSFGLSVVALIALLLVGINQTLAASGDLDSSFGSGGKVTTPVGSGRDLAQAMALQTDGKIVVAGYARNDFALVRYNPNGTLDATFGTGGKVITPIGTGVDEAYAIVIQPDGRIVAAGRAGSNFAAARYNPDGSLDSTFGNGGKVITDVSDFGIAEAVAVQNDGKIVVAGWSGSSPARYVVVRYNVDGSLDQTFGSAGRVFVTVGTSGLGGLAHTLALQTDGRIIVAGDVSFDAGQTTPFKFSLVRLTAAGALDASFGSGGTVATEIIAGGASRIYDVAVQPDGKILASGCSTAPGSGDSDTAVARYNANGSLDTSFGASGIASTRVGTIASEGEAICLQVNGKIVVAGSSYSGGAAGNDFGVVRFNADGSLDVSFGNNGKVITPIGSRDDLVRDAVIQPDGKILLAGFVEDAGAGFNEDFALVRYLGDATVNRRPAFDFDGDGKTDYGVFRPATGTWYLLNSQSGFAASAFGFGSDKLVPADFDGDGKTDIAVYRSGIWYLQRSQLGFIGIGFGAPDDIPVPADYTGDGKAEIAVFRPSNGTWYFYNLASNQTSATAFGASGDKPTPADFDGDGKADVAVFRPASGTWYVQRSATGFTGVAFGIAADKPTPADFDGDGKADIAVARQTSGTTVWYILGSTQGFYGVQFGADTDKLTAGDYDGDGKTDVAVWRNSTGAFYVLRSSGNLFSALQFGQSGDAPVATAFVP